MNSDGEKKKEEDLKTCCVCVQLDECFHADRWATLISFSAAAPTVQHIRHSNENWDKQRAKEQDKLSTFKKFKIKAKNNNKKGN